jgi:heme/copper-type cytochrome/quinol oxidase subunit 2
MKKLKYMFWLILVIFLGLVVYQNLAFFSSKHVLQINLGIYQRYTPEMTNGAIIAIFVGISVLIMMMLYTVSRYNGYRAKKNIKSLQAGIDERDNTIAKLTQEVELLKEGDGAVPALDVPDNQTQAQESIEDTAEAQSTPTQ